MTVAVTAITLSLVTPFILAEQCPGLNCGSHGTCQAVMAKNSVLGHECKCDDNWSGPECDVPYVTCDDGKRRCYNNSECRRNKKPDPETGVYGYHCDCSLAYGVSAFAGHECEYSATHVCETLTPVSRHAFCTNGGKCRAFILPGEDHPGCDCPPEFEGRHCQFLKGTAPAEEEERIDPLTYQKSHAGGERGGDLGGGAIAFIIVISLSVVAAIIVVARKAFFEKKSMERRIQDGSGSYSEDEYSLQGRDGPASDGASSSLASSLPVDADGSATMPKVDESGDDGASSGDAFHDEAQPAGEGEGEII